MVLQAGEQLSKNEIDRVRGYRIREGVLGQALVIPEEGQIELILSLRPSRSGRQVSDIWREFSIVSIRESGETTEHCRGSFSIELKSQIAALHEDRTMSEQLEANSKHFREVETLCNVSYDVANVYEDLRKAQLDYGPSFAIMTHASACADHSTATIQIPDTQSVMPSNFEHPFLLHPATIDGCLHSIFPIIIQQKGAIREPIMPTVIEDFFISRKICGEAGRELKIFAQTNFNNIRQYRSDIAVIDPKIHDSEPMIQITGAISTVLRGQGNGNLMSQRKPCCYRPVWRPAVDLNTGTKISSMLLAARGAIQKDDIAQERQQVAYYFIARALEQVSVDDVARSSPHLALLRDTMEHWHDLVKANKLPLNTDHWASANEEQREELVETCQHYNDQAQILHLIGTALPDILRGRISALELLLEDNRLQRLYLSMDDISVNIEAAADYIDLLAHKNPYLKICEVGAGTGSASLPILRKLGGVDFGLPRFTSYDYTDISTGFFPAAKAMLADWGKLVSYRKLDIEHDPQDQGFEIKSYDVVVAVNVLHATESVEETLKNVRSLLKPGGKLVLVELTNDKTYLTVLFGGLPGWWLGKHSQVANKAIADDEQASMSNAFMVHYSL